MAVLCCAAILFCSENLLADLGASARGTTRRANLAYEEVPSRRQQQQQQSMRQLAGPAATLTGGPAGSGQDAMLSPPPRPTQLPASAGSLQRRSLLAERESPL